jgi:hypothetical protein
VQAETPNANAAGATQYCAFAVFAILPSLIAISRPAFKCTLRVAWNS